MLLVINTEPLILLLTNQVNSLLHSPHQMAQLLNIGMSLIIQKVVVAVWLCTTQLNQSLILLMPASNMPLRENTHYI